MQQPLQVTIYREEYHDPFNRKSEKEILDILPTEAVHITVYAPETAVPDGLTTCIAILSAQFRENAGGMFQFASNVIN
jgi:hypothetical protein